MFYLIYNKLSHIYENDVKLTQYDFLIYLIFKLKV